MPPVITYLILGCMGLYVLVLVGDLFRTRKVRRYLLEGLALLVVFLDLRAATGFPEPFGRQAFGGLGPLPAIEWGANNRPTAHMGQHSHPALGKGTAESWPGGPVRRR